MQKETLGNMNKYIFKRQKNNHLLYIIIDIYIWCDVWEIFFPPAKWLIIRNKFL